MRYGLCCWHWELMWQGPRSSAVCRRGWCMEPHLGQPAGAYAPLAPWQPVAHSEGTPSGFQPRQWTGHTAASQPSKFLAFLCTAFNGNNTCDAYKFRCLCNDLVRVLCVWRLWMLLALSRLCRFVWLTILVDGPKGLPQQLGIRAGATHLGRKLDTMKQNAAGLTCDPVGRMDAFVA
jgi:hypothetical protein